MLAQNAGASISRRMTMRRRVSWSAALLMCLATSDVACSRWQRKARARGELSEAERAAISAFSSGAISRESPVRVVFASAVAEPAQWNTTLESSPFRFEPAIKGFAVWTGANQLEFRPSERLKDGQAYAASLDVERLSAGKLKLSRFEFDFSAMRQSFEVSLDGLEAADAAAPKRQKLTGKLITADVEDAALVEKLLKPNHGKDTLTVAWTHEPNRRVHAFAVSGIERAEDASTLRLVWDGAPIGVEKREAKDVLVPGLNAFAVNQARAVQGKEQYLELRFSDPLQMPQNLQGLVTMAGKDDLRFHIAGSVVEVYSAKGFRGDQTVKVASGIKNAAGYRLREASEHTVAFEALKPQVRFAGKGVIVPTSTGLTVPIETVNLRAVTVEATRIPESVMPQFLQTNDLAGEHELHRVGRVVWKSTIPLDVTPDKENRFLSFGLDVTPLTKAYPGGLYRLTLSFKRAHVLWKCDGQPEDVPLPAAPTAGSPEEQEASAWDAWEGDDEGDWQERYNNRDNPCHASFYRPFYDHNIRVGRNVLVSDIGLIAKAGEDDQVTVIATDIRSATPLQGAEITLRDFQQQPVATGRTNSDGFVKLPVDRKPFLAVARSGRQTGYLRLDDGGALQMAHFDVAGVRAPKGLKGFLYGERGVWRPGDTLFMTFVLFDAQKRLAAEHPVRFELVDPRGRLVKTLTKSAALDGFYAFEVETSPDAPTGNYLGRVSVGGATFERTLKVETIMPNRLKIALDFPQQVLGAGSRLAAVLKSSWLTGALARGLKADVEMTLQAAQTRFAKYPDYVFDDPTRKYETEKQTVFEGQLDENGSAKIDAEVAAENVAPGQLQAHFTTRVFEPGGAFSIDRFSLPYSPYERYVGLRAPKGDAARGMLLTDTKHPIDIVALDAKGQPTGDGEVELKLYKVDWRWWWERGEEDWSSFAESDEHTPLQEATVALKNGVGAWSFEVKYPEWGRYLIVAADKDGGHRTGRVVYVDWPGWAGRGQKEGGRGATVLAFAPDKAEYAVGDTVTLTLPTPKQGRALVSIESGARVLRSAWLEATGTETHYSFPASAEMAPNVYAHVTLLQPHSQTGNDLPIRLYGIAAVKVTNAQTKLKPFVEAAEVFAPEATASVRVREASGRPMTYTLAVVDEGLLGLTRHQTPNPWDHFYAREALAVKTWDVYDHVVGVYGAAMERMLAIGGDDAGGPAAAKRANRFPPMVRFLGPFQLAKGQTNSHDVAIPRYVGAVRVMVVAGKDGAFGAAEKSVFVRRPLMLLGTLPRVLGPEEEVALPVSVFALEPQVKNVTVSLQASGPLSVLGPSSKTLTFKAIGDEMVTFRLGVKPSLGVASVVLRAESGTERAEQKIELDVRPQTLRSTDVLGAVLKPGESWRPALALPGQPGSNEATLEVSRIPPLDLGRRLEYLMQYPHGCLEQTVSGAFPQIFLGKLLDLPKDKQARVERNVKAGLERLKRFQTSEGAFAYWPGNVDYSNWANTYAGHFMVEAKKAGYLPPAGLLEQWLAFERRRARAWAPESGPGQAELVQAYRLYALALAGAPELPAMNQLRERRELQLAARWRLAAAYQLAGQPEAARALAAKASVTVKPYRELAFTFGSDLRDRAMILEALLLLDMPEQVAPLVKSVSDSLAAQAWLSTQETAYALLALARGATDPKDAAPASFSYAWNGAAPVGVTSARPVVQVSLANPKPDFALTVQNTGGGVLYPRLIVSGLPPAGRETAASNGLKLELQYLSATGTALDPSQLGQGTDFKVVAKVTNTGERGQLSQLALTQVFASGWEIHNQRMDLAQGAGAKTNGIDYQDLRDDRVSSYFALKAGEAKTVELRLNASYLGRFYLPMVSVEAMYDATLNARARGQWVQVVPAGNP
jgi:uncharacterized protein YfaS (alpha-2-macroglobulin family)